PSQTCASPDDPRCKPPSGVTPIVETSVQTSIETIMPTPDNNNGDNKDEKKKNQNNDEKKKKQHKITSYTTITTTITLYYAGYTTTMTTTNSLGKITTFATYIPPSTVIVVKTMVSPVTLAVDEDLSSTTIRLHEFNSHSLWGVTMSLIVVFASLIISVFA
ncbi:3591_t:CDS:2, partial [Funneliformis caledonium]